MLTPEAFSVLSCIAATTSVAGSVVSYRWLARARAIADADAARQHPAVLTDAAVRVRYLRALSVVGVTLEAMRRNLEGDAAASVFGNVAPPVAELADLCDSAARLGHSLDVGILHATVYWLREHCYQHAFTDPSPELHECRARVDAALWETRRLLGIAEGAPLPRTLADVEAMAELASPAAIPAQLPRQRGRRSAARRDARAAAQPVARTAGAR